MPFKVLRGWHNIHAYIVGMIAPSFPQQHWQYIVSLTLHLMRARLSEVKMLAQYHSTQEQSSSIGAQIALHRFYPFYHTASCVTYLLVVNCKNPAFLMYVYGKKNC